MYMDVFIIAKHKLALNYFLQTLIIVVIDFKRKHTYIDDSWVLSAANRICRIRYHNRCGI